MNVLVVDDDEIALAIASKAIVSDGHQIFTAEDGFEALDVLRSNDIQVVISDWNMPRMNGLELCKRIRSEVLGKFIYVMFVTARTGKEDLLTGLSAGADDFITKPFEPAEMILRVRNAERIFSRETTALTLFSMAKLAESKDTDTGFHLERIREYARILAEQIILTTGDTLKLPIRFPEMMFQTSPLHDIGKVGIPDYVLLKPGSLSDGEWQVMKRHTEIGAETLDAVLQQYPGADYLRIARDIAWSHHERWDGSGYPRGLKGEEIPLAARIIAVADVYDAITMKRVYKRALPHEVASGLIHEGSGTIFDPMVVAAFQSVEARFLEVKESFDIEPDSY